MNQPRAILSDADGTLVDTVQLIRHGQYETLVTYLVQREIATSDIPDYQTFEMALNASVGGSARDTLEKTARILFQDRPDFLETINYDDLHDHLNPIQDRLAPTYITAYDGLSEFLYSLGRNHIKLAIFTSGTKHHVVRNFGIALPELGLAGLFTDAHRSEDEKFDLFLSVFKEQFGLPDFTVVTCEYVATHKPDPASIRFAMQKLGLDAKECLVLGDHAVDMQSGVNASVPRRVGISHGFHDHEVLLRAGATSVIDSLRELTDMLQSTV